LRRRFWFYSHRRRFFYSHLAFIGAALRVGHYEIAAYTTAGVLALQLHQPEIARLMTNSLGQEKNAGHLLGQVDSLSCQLRACPRA
jgi:ferritin-like metal-binding protein YciE